MNTGKKHILRRLRNGGYKIDNSYSLYTFTVIVLNCAFFHSHRAELCVFHSHRAELCIFSPTLISNMYEYLEYRLDFQKLSQLSLTERIQWKIKVVYSICLYRTYVTFMHVRALSWKSTHSNTLAEKPSFQPFLGWQRITASGKQVICPCCCLRLKVSFAKEFFGVLRDFEDHLTALSWE